MKKTEYINPKEVKEISVWPESEAHVYEWYDREPPKKKTILWGLITIGWTKNIPEGWGSCRYNDDHFLNWGSIKIDRSGLKPKLISTARVIIYFGYKHTTTVYYDTNEEAINFAEDVANESGCTIKIER